MTFQILSRFNDESAAEEAHLLMIEAMIGTFGMEAVMAALEGAGFEDLDAFLKGGKDQEFVIGDLLHELLGFGAPAMKDLPDGGLGDASQAFESHLDISDDDGFHEYWFDFSGNNRVVKEVHTDWDNNEVTRTYKYGKNGKLTEETYENSETGEKYTKKITDWGDFEEYEIYDKSGKKVAYGGRMRDEDGNVVFDAYHDNNGNSRVTENKYNDQGSITKSTKKENGKVVETVEIEYNEDGSAKSFTRKDADGNVIEHENYNEPDKKNDGTTLTDPDAGFATGTGDGLKDPDVPVAGEPDPENTMPSNPWVDESGEGELPESRLDPTYGTILVDPEKDMLVFVEIPEDRLDPTYGLIDPPEDGDEAHYGGVLPELRGVQQFFVVEADGDFSIQEGIVMDNDQVLFL